MMDNVIEDKSFRFAVRIVKLCQYLQEEKRNTPFQSSSCAVVPVSVLMWLKPNRRKAVQTLLPK